MGILLLFMIGFSFLYSLRSLIRECKEKKQKKDAPKPYNPEV